MKAKIKLKIGEFSKICQVTVKTLRFYEEKLLLQPLEVDAFTGYRYYGLEQLKQMNQIQYLKQLGFSIDEIAQIVSSDSKMPSLQQINDKIMSCRMLQSDLKKRKRELILLKKNLNLNRQVMIQVELKTLPARIFATHRAIVNSYQDLFNLCPNVIMPEMQRLGCECTDPQYCFTIEYQEEYGKNIDIEYYEAVKEKGEDSDIIKFKTLPQVPVAICYNHYGPYAKFPDAFAKLFEYVEQNGYTVMDKPRICYIDGIWNKESEQEWLSEIQVPVAKL